MTIIAIQRFGGQKPRLSSRLLAISDAEIAMNAKVWNGKLAPFMQPLDVFTTFKAGPILSVFNYRFPGSSAWLHWATDVDVATSPLALDTNARLYYTGDGRPKITDSSIAANVTRSVAADASSGQPTFTIVGPIKGFQAGDTISVGYVSGAQSAVIQSCFNAVPNSTITLTTNLTSTLTSGRTVTNTSKRFPLGSYDLGVPAPLAALTTIPESENTGNVVSVNDIFIAAIDSGSNYENSVTLIVAANDGDTSVSYNATAFPSEIFSTGDLIQISAVSGMNIQTLLVATVTPVSGNIVIAFGPGVTIGGGGFPMGSPLVNLSRGAETKVEKPTNLTGLVDATTKSFIANEGVGAPSIQIDVDNKFQLTLANGAINSYQNIVGKGGFGQFRFTHYIRRESDGVLIFEEPHVWQLKDGFQQTPATEGESFKVSIVDTPPDGGSRYTVGTLIDKAEQIYTGPSEISISTKIRVRYAARVLVTLESADNDLAIGDRIKLDLFPVMAGLNAPSLDNKTVLITATSLQFLTVEGQIGGQYAFGGTYKQVFLEDEISPRTYVYTYVATIGGQEMEGAPSPPSPVIDIGSTQSVTVTGFANPLSPFLWDTNFTAIRLYRFQESASGTGEYLFHSELALDSTGISDSKMGDELLEPLSTVGYLTPPADMKGLIELPNGLVAGFSGKELLYPVPFQLHAWPLEHRRAIHDEIVAIGAFGNAVAVSTEGKPQVFTGDDPATVSTDRIEVIEPNLSKRGSVDIGYGFAYASQRGLVVVSSSRAEVVTMDLFTEDEWMELNPASFVACRFGDRYLCFYDTGGVAPSFTEHSKGGFIIDTDPRSARLVFLDFWATEAWSDDDTGKTYIVQDGIVKEFDMGELEYEYVWRSKPIVLPFPESMAVAKVEAVSFPVHITFLVEDGDGSTNMIPLFSRKLHSGGNFRLPSGLYQRWQIEVRGVHEIEGLYMATDVEELQKYGIGQ